MQKKFISFTYEEKNMDYNVTLFCNRRTCKFYMDLKNKITKAGKYTTASDPIGRQLHFCHGGQHKFSETGYSNIFQKHGSFLEYEQVAKMTTQRLSTDKIAEVLYHDKRTINSWQTAIADKCASTHIFYCFTIGLVCSFLQLDEIWSYINNKTRQLWGFMAIEVESRFWIGFELGSRTTYTANKMLAFVAKAISSKTREIVKVTTDKLAAYKKALAKFFMDIDYVYLQIVKKRYKKRLKTVKKEFIKGCETDFPNKTQNTSYIERFNLTVRQRISYFVRKTLGYPKNKTKVSEVLWINLFDYNYCCYHRSLREQISDSKERFVQRYKQQTPAMKMGLEQEKLTWKYLLLRPVPV
jgi:IS1 family transposase